MTEKEQQREHQTVSYLCSTLANICSAPPNMVIDALTGLLWDKEEAGQIKVANMPEEPSKETLEAAGHRLALELECLILDCKDNVVVSRWMDTACEALDAWQKLFPYNGPRLGD